MHAHSYEQYLGPSQSEPLGDSLSTPIIGGAPLAQDRILAQAQARQT